MAIFGMMPPDLNGLKHAVTERELQQTRRHGWDFDSSLGPCGSDRCVVGVFEITVSTLKKCIQN